MWALADTCKHAEEVQAYKSEANSLRTALTTCKEEIKFLKHKLMTVESNLSEEVAERDAQIGRLSAEVERRARIIAHLTKQLHQMKVEFTRFLEEASLVQSVGATVVPGQDHSGHQRTTVVEPPATAVGRIRRRTRRATSSAAPHEPDVPHEKTAPRRSLPTPVTHSPPPPPSASPRPPSTSPPPRSRQRSSRLLRRAAQTATSTPERSPPLQRPSTNLDPVRIQKPAPDITEILRNNSVSSTPNLSRSVAPILPPIPTNPSLLGSQRNPASSARRLQENEERRERRLLVKEELPHEKGHAWQELHQSGSD